MPTSSPGKGPQMHVLAVWGEGAKHVLYAHHPLDHEKICVFPTDLLPAAVMNNNYDPLENTLKKVP